MVLIFSDIHLGRSPEKDHLLASELSACISSYKESLDEVIFLGDVFESYMEYPGRIDSEVEIIAPIIHDIRSRDIRVSYYVGNHDPWHLGYFEKRFSVIPEQRGSTRVLYNRTVHLSHGDEQISGGVRSRLARYFMRTPIYYSLYRLLPATLGQALPRWISRRFADSEPNSDVTEQLALAAERMLRSSELDVICFGHAHAQHHLITDHGEYFNSGSWYHDLSFLEVQPNMTVLRKWQPTVDS